MLSLAACGLALAILLTPRAALGETRVYAKGEGERIDVAAAATRTGSSSVALSALRGETVAFQVIVDAGDDALSGITVEAPSFTSEGLRPIPVQELIEHFVPVRARSRDTGDLPSSLAWRAGSRPADDDMIGALPDALIPIDIARCSVTAVGPGRTFCPYPLSIPARSVGAVWMDVTVPEDQASGRYLSRVFVRHGREVIGSIDVTLETSETVLPFRPVDFFAYYAFDSLQDRFDDPATVERGLWRLLHSHRVDAMTALTSEEDASRVAGAYSGEWFTRASGYEGPGVGVPPRVSGIGAYGSLGEPTPANVDRALAIARTAAAPSGDTFVYTVDEQCESPLGKAWRDALKGRSPALLAGATCGDDPSRQAADLVMMAAQDFDLGLAARARGQGKKVYVYNGQLPFAGPLMLDAPLTSLTADGWLAVSYDVGRWYFWETTFWNDSNRGGRGPRDVFADPETFHNADGDACLLDGLLVYPGRDRRFPEHSLDTDAVLPSMRLQALRRGIEDAGLASIAATVDLDATRRISGDIVWAAFDEASPGAAPGFTLDPERLEEARNELRRIAARAKAASSASEVETTARKNIAELRARRLDERHRALVPQSLEGPFVLLAAGALFASAYAALAFASGARRDKRRRGPSRAR